ncbi:isocitrate lyase/phosphoenolpyruvate mutase family protein [Streptomyces sp. Agncl-13]|uniref:isocitrate lyase/phosphoenolpyruvate mutase family protein n=1 Tax=Streptomyces sp. Agncl-13 TaxID=3400628 RepID=UPI003A856215
MRHPKSRILRKALSSAAPVTVVGANSGLTAVLAENAGFEAVWVSSFEVSAARALPDTSLLSMTDYLQTAVQVDRATSLPVVADCDTGFGNALNVAHMVREYEASGIAAVCIEDKVFPKINSFAPGAQRLVDADEFARRIAVGKDVQSDPDFLLIARTEAYIAGYGTDEVLRRAEMYADAGADAVLIHSKSDGPEQITDFMQRWTRPCPVVVVPTTYYHWTVDEARQAGVSMVIYANHGLRASIAAVREIYGSIRDTGSSAKVEQEIASVSEVFALQQLDSWLAMESK